MQPEVTRKLQALQSDFVEVTGKPFRYFFCPILFKDEASELCKAHIVNAAFPESPRVWTVQRQDVDNFFGAEFESDFVDLQHRKIGVVPEAFFDRTLHGRMRPQILCNGRVVEYFYPKGPVPEKFTEVDLASGNRTVRLALKMSPTEYQMEVNAHWQTAVHKDLRLPAVVSVLKAAHLTLFEMWGYRYAFSVGGRYIGQHLGMFFTQNVGRPRKEVIEKARTFFAPLAVLMRPVADASPKPGGSVENGVFRVCWCEGRSSMWGVMVFVRTYDLEYACVLPMFCDNEGAERFGRHLEFAADTLETSIAHSNNGNWQIEEQRRTLKWPAAALN